MYKIEYCDKKRYFTCSNCDKRFETKFNCERHTKKACIKPSTICKDCGVDFIFECKLQKHKERKYKCNSVYQCSLENGCSKIFKYKSQLETHMNKKTKCNSVKKTENKSEPTKEEPIKEKIKENSSDVELSKLLQRCAFWDNSIVKDKSKNKSIDELIKEDMERINNSPKLKEAEEKLRQMHEDRKAWEEELKRMEEKRKLIRLRYEAARPKPPPPKKIIRILKEEEIPRRRFGALSDSEVD